jgi:hypothetical protein
MNRRALLPVDNSAERRSPDDFFAPGRRGRSKHAGSRRAERCERRANLDHSGSSASASLSSATTAAGHGDSAGSVPPKWMTLAQYLASGGSIPLRLHALLDGVAREAVRFSFPTLNPASGYRPLGGGQWAGGGREWRVRHRGPRSGEMRDAAEPLAANY